jgi:hypothetical protein
MTQLEDAIRRALRARASEVRPPLPPLELRPRHASGRATRVTGYRLWNSAQLRWLAPAAAVITVLAVIGGLLLARAADRGRDTGPAATIETSVPAYYVALVSDTPLSSSNAATMRTVATVRITATGSEVASVAPPAPYTTFEKVSGATDDRTFVLLAAGPEDHSGLRAERFYLLHIDPQAALAASRTQLTALPGADIPAGRQVETIALSPNGADLAAILGSGFANFLYVYNLQTESIRIWTKRVCSTPAHCFDGSFATLPVSIVGGSGPELSWTQDSQSLAFIPGGGGTGDGRLRLLHIDRPGGNVEPASTVFHIRRNPHAAWNGAVLTPDRKTVFIGYTALQGASYWYFLARYSSVTRKVTDVNKLLVLKRLPAAPYWSASPYPKGEAIDDVVWTSYDGGEAVVLNAGHGHSAGIYAGSHYTPLPWPRDAVDAAW